MSDGSEFDLYIGGVENVPLNKETICYYIELFYYIARKDYINLLNHSGVLKESVASLGDNAVDIINDAIDKLLLIPQVHAVPNYREFRNSLTVLLTDNINDIKNYILKFGADENGNPNKEIKEFVDVIHKINHFDIICQKMEGMRPVLKQFLCSNLPKRIEDPKTTHPNTAHPNTALHIAHPAHPNTELPTGGKSRIKSSKKINRKSNKKIKRKSNKKIKRKSNKKINRKPRK